MTNQRELAEFERKVDAWMAGNKPADPGFVLPETFMEVGTDRQFEFLRDWQNKVCEAGYVGMAWPKAYGGGVALSEADGSWRRCSSTKRPDRLALSSIA